MDEQNTNQGSSGNGAGASDDNFEPGVPTAKSEQLTDQKLMNKSISSGVQNMINKPQMDPTGVDDADKKFMELVVKLVSEGTIDVHKPATLMNSDIYDGLSEKLQGKVDIYAVSLLRDLQQMKLLHDSGDTQSFQIQNLVHRVRLAKEILEKECGDVYII